MPMEITLNITKSDFYMHICYLPHLLFFRNFANE